MYWTLELASWLEDAPWPATKDELIDYANRSGLPEAVLENLQEIEEDDLVFSVGQALLAAKAGATYVSPFVGRLDDISEDGVALVAHIVKVYRTYGYKTQVLAASIRHTQHIIQCLDAGADVATCPLAAIEGLLRHPLTDSGLEKFLADHARLNV